MDPDAWVIPLDQAAGCSARQIGGKAHNLARLLQDGFRVAPGFCVSVAAYQRFLRAADLTRFIQIELGRKPFEEMRWEEMWDAALRIRNRFATTELPEELAAGIAAALAAGNPAQAWAVRSSAPGEDSGNASFAGLHDSFLDVGGEQAVLDAVRLVWASLWSDAALLYRKELGLNPLKSQMAVLIQQMVDGRPSGVAFGCDPRTNDHNVAVIEAVPGSCADLVDGNVDPDRWLIRRRAEEPLQQRVSYQPGEGRSEPLLQQADLIRLIQLIETVEQRLQWSPDIEWNGRLEQLTVLQARPVTRPVKDPDQQRAWCLTLRPGADKLRALCHRVTEQLIPDLEQTGRLLAAEDVAGLNDRELADCIEKRQATVRQWKRIYWDEFIPFAHGVRYLGLYYNDAVRPADPYEFVGLLRGEKMLAVQRNSALGQLARHVHQHPRLKNVLRDAISRSGSPAWSEWEDQLAVLPGGVEFCESFQQLMQQFMDISVYGHRLSEDPRQLVRNVLEFAGRGETLVQEDQGTAHAAELEQRLLRAVGPDRHSEAREVIRMGRLSWRLRDDDNILVAKLESQLLRAVQTAAERLQRAGRLNADAQLDEEAQKAICNALRSPSAESLVLPTAKADQQRQPTAETRERRRQLIGQPAAPGFATGTVRVIRAAEDLGAFRAGEILVCDAIQPMMTHIVPLAAGVIERRGGMLIHGAIIARELGVPCVNGVPDAAQQLSTGQSVAVDGHLGIVTVGPPEFDLELGNEK